VTHIEPTIILLDPSLENGLADLVGPVPEEHPAREIITALRRLRARLRDTGGARLVALADDALCDRLAIRLLQISAAAGIFGEGVSLQPRACSDRAEAIMLAAADTCSRYSTTTSASRAVFYAMLILLDRLVEALDGPIDTAQLMNWLQDREPSAGWQPVQSNVASLDAVRKSRSRSKQSRQSSAM
jgi:hypothetical protein